MITHGKPSYKEQVNYWTGFAHGFAFTVFAISFILLMTALTSAETVTINKTDQLAFDVNLTYENMTNSTEWFLTFYFHNDTDNNVTINITRKIEMNETSFNTVRYNYTYEYMNITNSTNTTIVNADASYYQYFDNDSLYETMGNKLTERLEEVEKECSSRALAYKEQASECEQRYTQCQVNDTIFYSQIETCELGKEQAEDDLATYKIAIIILVILFMAIFAWMATGGANILQPNLNE